MKVELKKSIRFFEVDAKFRLRPRALLNYLQEAMAVHTDNTGYGSLHLMAQGNAWILHRMAIQIHRHPVMDDELTISTWHRGGKGFRGYRDFEIYARDEKLVSASSLWLFIDLERKKILKIPKETRQWYTIEKDKALDVDIDNWKPIVNYTPEMTSSIEIRPSDYDPLGHVNNAVYFDFIEIMISKFFNKKQKLHSIIMQYSREIPKGVKNLEIGFQKNKEQYDFKLFSPTCVHAAGQFRLSL